MFGQSSGNPLQYKRTRYVADHRSAAILLALIVYSISGCAVHYYDPQTGAEHIWGIGHMVMRASPPNEGRLALVRGTNVIGLAVGSVGGEGYVTLGWEQRHRLEIVDENAAIRLDWPDGSLLNVRVGSPWPASVEQPCWGGEGVQR